MAHRLDGGPITRSCARCWPTINAAGQKPNLLSLKSQMHCLAVDHKLSHMNRSLQEIGHEDLTFPDEPYSGLQGVAIRQFVGDDNGELAILLWHDQSQGLKIGMSAEVLQGLGPLLPFQPSAAPDGQPS